MTKSEPTPNYAVEDLLEELVEAQNRTTAAVRSIALFLFLTTATGFIGAMVYFAGVTKLDSKLTYVGGLIIICGAIISLAVGVIELLSSNKNRS